jgi:hypothetical protein
MNAFDKLRRDFDGCLAEVLGVARAAATTGGAAWRAIVEATTGAPPAGLPPAGEAANPAEVRDVLLALQALYERRLDVVERALTGDVADEAWTFRHRRLDRFVPEELAAYIEAVTPRPSVGSVFARAARKARGSSPPPAQAPPSVQLHRCRTCGAPRLRDGLYGDCLYCGHPFFTGEIRS